MEKQGFQKLQPLSILKWRQIFIICRVEEEEAAGRQGCTCLHKLVIMLLLTIWRTMTFAAPWRLSR